VVFEFALVVMTHSVLLSRSGARMVGVPACGRLGGAWELSENVYGAQYADAVARSTSAQSRTLARSTHSSTS
jgi:hypothetical protein